MGSSKKQTIGYKYYLSVHAAFVHGPLDSIVELRFDDRVAYSGNWTGGEITIDQPSLFGGEQREGGVGGTIELCQGDPSQLQNPFLVDRCGPLVPAYRGVAALIFKNFYWGNNPYFKTWAARASRIHTRSDGSVQWYDAKAEIAGGGPGVVNTLVTLGGTANAGLTSAVGVTVSGLDPAKVYYLHLLNGSAWARYDVPNPASWSNSFRITTDAGTTAYFEELGFFPSADASVAAVADQFPIPITGHSSYTFWIYDSPTDDNQGNLQFRFTDGGVPQGDMNPAHIIREALTDRRWGMGYDELADVDDVSFTAAADTLYDEAMGISLIWDQQMPIEDFIKEVLRHIDAALFVASRGPAAGKFVLKLIRNDYNVEDLITLDESTVVSIDGWKQTQIGEMINSITVNYWDPARSGTGSVTVSDPALVLQQGAVVNTTQHYEGFTNYGIASRVAERDLHGLSVPLYSGNITALWDPANELEIGDAFVLSFPDLQVESVVMRVTAMGRGDGRDHNVKLTVAQDVFSLPTQPMVSKPTTDWTDPADSAAAPLTNRVALELPYRELVQLSGQSSVDAQLTSTPDAGYVGAAAARGSSAVNAEMWTDAGGGYAKVGVLDFCPSATLGADASLTDTTLALTNASSISEVAVGSAALIGSEWVIVTSVSPTSLVCERGTIDTVPQAHAAGTVVYFLDNFTEQDSTQYTDGETVGVKLLPVAGTNTLALASAPADSVTLASRAARPYPPGKVRIAGNAAPSAVSGSFGVTWTHRDRKGQADQLLGTEASSVGPETGVRYGLRFENASTGAVIVERLDLNTDTATVQLGASAPASVRAKLWAISDVGDSWQTHERVFSYSGGSGSPSIDGTTYVPGDGSTLIDGNDPPGTTPAAAPAIGSGGAGTPGTPTARSTGTTVVVPSLTAGSAAAAANTNAINSAFAGFTPGVGGIVRLPAGDYWIDPTITIQPLSNCELDLETNDTQLYAINGGLSTGSSHKDLINCAGVHDVVIHGGMLVGFRDAWAAAGGMSYYTPGTSEWNHGISIGQNSYNITVYNMSFKKMTGDGISVGKTAHDIHLLNLLSSDNRRQGFSLAGISASANIKIEKCEGHHIGLNDGTAPMAGLDCEVDGPDVNSTSGIQILDCYFHDNIGPGVIVYKSMYNITITNLRSKFNLKGIYGVDSHNVTMTGTNDISYNKYEGLQLLGSCSNWAVKANFFDNKTKQYGSPAGTTTTTPTSTQKAKHVTIASTVTGLTYDPATTWGAV